jgi:hypothetical protein
MPSSEPKPITLDQWLGRCYGAPRGLAPADSQAQFAKALQEDNALREAATAKLAELEALAAAVGGDLTKRCVLSKSALDALHALLK